MLHFGPPCQSMTFAHSYVWGRPGISEAQQALVDLGNALAFLFFLVLCCSLLPLLLLRYRKSFGVVAVEIASDCRAGRVSGC